MLINQNTLVNLKDIIKSAKKFLKKFTPRGQLPNLLRLNFWAKFLTERIYIMHDLSSVRQKMSSDDIKKSINSHRNNKFPGNDGLTTE